MYLIADAGKTKIKWFYGASLEEWMYFSSDWYSPSFEAPEVLEQILKNKVFGHVEWDKISHVYYFWAGCRSQYPKSIIDVFKSLAPDSEITIDNDIIWAAMASVWKKRGIVAILWTGSNSALRNGNKMLERKWGHGILLWSEWSWWYLWNKLLHAYLYEILPNDLQEKLDEKWTKVTLKRSIYGSNDMYKEVASWSRFYSDHRGHDWIEEKLYECFKTFFDLTITRYEGYENLPLWIIGSVGRYFQDVVKQVALDSGVKEISFEQYPIGKLVNNLIQQ